MAHKTFTAGRLYGRQEFPEADWRQQLRGFLSSKRGQKGKGLKGRLGLQRKLLKRENLKLQAEKLHVPDAALNCST